MHNWQHEELAAYEWNCRARGIYRVIHDVNVKSAWGIISSADRNRPCRGQDEQIPDWRTSSWVSETWTSKMHRAYFSSADKNMTVQSETPDRWTSSLVAIYWRVSRSETTCRTIKGKSLAVQNPLLRHPSSHTPGISSIHHCVIFTFLQSTTCLPQVLRTSTEIRTTYNAAS